MESRGLLTTVASKKIETLFDAAGELMRTRIAFICHFNWFDGNFAFAENHIECTN